MGGIKDMITVLLVDDETALRKMTVGVLETDDITVIEAENGEMAVEKFRSERPDLVLMDIKMPKMTGDKALVEIKAIDPAVPVLMMSAYSDVNIAIECMKNGAYDFIHKPIQYPQLMAVIKRIASEKLLEREAEEAKSSLKNSLARQFGPSDKMKEVIDMLIQASKTKYSVIIQGETGTGKSLIARTIHDIGVRSTGPFVVVDIGSIPETLVESELFGHEKGAFTGADRKKKGYFEAADGGTIFIDEIHNIPLHTQAKILRVVEEKKVCPVGSPVPVNIDVRVIAATNIDLKKASKEKKFREDLFFRMNEFLINVPALRERVEDIPLFVDKFLGEAADDHGKRLLKADEQAIGLLKSGIWEGNIRELRNIVKRAALMSEGDELDPEQVKKLMGSEILDFPCEGDLSVKKTLREVETEIIKEALAQTGGNKKKAAEIIGMTYRTMMRRAKGIVK
ncbi:MAG: sigma-54-dependent Fis family transcriptional regulator [Nitrospirae bacterium]|nr:MAG: sigma-54-dependent Fis family transcriptional regulator [Nitrospirota bacterium]